MFASSALLRVGWRSASAAIAHRASPAVAAASSVAASSWQAAASHTYSPAATFTLQEVKNEPFLHYEPGSVERDALLAAVEKLQNECPDIPCIVNGEEIRTGQVSSQTMPTRHAHKLCTFHEADPETLAKAAAAAVEAREAWEARPLQERQSVYLKAADLLSTKYRAELCAATMLGQGKNIWQAEIDAAVELIDFWRFAADYAAQIYENQPPCTDKGIWNRMEYRALEGFVLAISPFNFTAIGGNLHSAPGIMGNTCVWKPSPTAILSNWLVFKILKEAGLPDGVLNWTPCSAENVANHLIPHADMAGLHFTGSTNTFNTIYRNVASNLEGYKTYPRIVGETGGKNFHFVHESADVETVIAATIRGAFEYQGQKCSATSRMYVPSTLWPQIKEGLIAAAESLSVGCVTDPKTFVAAVIDGTSFNKIKGFIDYAAESDDAEILTGGTYDDSVGYFVQPTIIETSDPKFRTMTDEIFGPVLTCYVYEPDQLDETMELCDKTSLYGLTGSIFARDIDVVAKANSVFRHAAGNFYINDKSTGSMVGQQPFGGARGSGTNDKSGSFLNLMRWTSVRSVKEQFLPQTNILYPSNQ